jgi:RHS repeat-associated protein
VAQVDQHWNAAPWGSAGGIFTQYTYQSTGEPTIIEQSTYGGDTPGSGTRMASTFRSLAYDSLGHLVLNWEPNVGEWAYAYDAEGRLVGTSDARGCGENIYYDPGGRILAADYVPCGGAGQAAYTSPTIAPGTFPYAGAEESYAYDPNTGVLTKAADRARSDSYVYDAAGHLSQIDRQMALPGSPLEYGAVYQENFDQFTLYDQVMTRRLNGLVLGEYRTVNENTEYTMDGRVADIYSFPLGTLVSNTQYDASERPTAMTLGQPGTSAAGLSAPVVSYGYDPNGALQTYSLQRTASGSPKTGGGYTPPMSGDHLLLTTLMNVTIGRDRVGNPMTVTDAAAAGWPNGSPSGSQSYKYYDDYRIHTYTSTADATGVDPGADPYAYEHSAGSPLYGWSSPPGTSERAHLLSFAYDGRGNITSSSDDANDFFSRSLGTVAPVGSVRGAATDQITSATSPSGETLSVVYDPAGNVTAVQIMSSYVATSTFSYAWDELGNLASACRVGAFGADSVCDTFTYSAGGERTSIARSINGADPTYTVSVFDALVLKNAQFTGDYEDDASTEQIYLVGGMAHVFHDASGTMPQAPVSPSQVPMVTTHTFWNLPDPLGSGAFVVDQGTGELVEQTSYLPYGGLDSDWRNPTRWGSPREDLKFLGQWDDGEVGLVYLNARYYSPQLGRFISPDPLTIHGVAGDPNPYEYGYGNPISHADPSGFLPEDPPTTMVDAPPPAPAPVAAPAPPPAVDPGPSTDPDSLPAPSAVPGPGQPGTPTAPTDTAPTSAAEQPAASASVGPDNGSAGASYSPSQSGADRSPGDVGNSMQQPSPAPPGLDVGHKALEISEQLFGPAVDLDRDSPSVRRDKEAAGAVMAVSTFLRLPGQPERFELHGNSKLSTKAQHVYEILQTDSKGNTELFKVGVSDGKLLLSGLSARAQRQVRTLTRAANKSATGYTYQSSVVQQIAAGAGARTSALALERQLVYAYKALTGYKPPGNQRP